MIYQQLCKTEKWLPTPYRVCPQLPVGRIISGEDNKDNRDNKIMHSEPVKSLHCIRTGIVTAAMNTSPSGSMYSI